MDLPVEHCRQQVEGAALPEVGRKRFENFPAVNVHVVQLALGQEVGARLAKVMLQLVPLFGQLRVELGSGKTGFDGRTKGLDDRHLHEEPLVGLGVGGPVELVQDFVHLSKVPVLFV